MAWNNALISTLFAGVGVLTVLSLLFKLLSAFYLYFVRSSTLARYQHTSSTGSPPWALVTGATSGIGLAFAHELAARGFNIVLHGRNAAKLERVRAELEAAAPTRSFRLVVADAARMPCEPCLTADSTEDPAADVADAVEDLHLTTLVLNAGGAASPIYGTLDSYPAASIAGSVSLNALFPLHLLARLLPKLASAGPALVLVVGSLADSDLPLLSFYASSKLFLGGMVRCVARELALPGDKRDVEILALRAGKVTGVSHLSTPPRLLEPHARQWVRVALARVGCGRSEVVPWWPHALQVQVIMRLLPGWLKERIVVGIMMDLRDKETRGTGTKVD